MLALDFVCEALAHAQTGLVDRNAVDDRIGSGQIDVYRRCTD